MTSTSGNELSLTCCLPGISLHEDTLQIAGGAEFITTCAGHRGLVALLERFTGVYLAMSLMSAP